MNADQQPTDFPEVQAAIYRVALSLDSLLTNGIPYGVLIQQPGFSDGFLQKLASNLLSELARLEGHAPQAPAARQSEVRDALAALRTQCRQLIDVLTDLKSYRNLSPPQLQAALDRVRVLHAECATLIQAVEDCFSTPKRFYHSRPPGSPASVDAFLADLEHLFAEGNISIVSH
jgi:hypothetical protein